MLKIAMPAEASKIISRLCSLGYEAYLVGGCVRDSLLGLVPKDWDICTNATPPEVEEAFNDYRIICTGLKHGTVTVIGNDNRQYEVTTFRKDGEYSDCRRPDSVTFVNDITEDLSRRDFTMNAIAYNNIRGLVDPFNGRQAIADRQIACVGNPNDRFNEDALRIMRALRFASKYGFGIDGKTSEAIHSNRELLKRIASERINVELCGLLRGGNAANVLLAYSDIIATIIPEIKPCIGFNQNNRFHKYDVYEHIVRAIESYQGNDIIVKMSLLLHDIGKPQCYTEDEKGGHFYDHAKTSYDLATRVVDRLKFSRYEQDSITELVLCHDGELTPSLKTARRWLNKLGEEQLLKLIEVRRADILSHSDFCQPECLAKLDSFTTYLQQVLQEEESYQVKHLKVNGYDIMAFGVEQGKRVGGYLNEILNLVIDGQLSNDREELLGYLSRRIKNE